MIKRMVGLWMKHLISSPAVCERGVCLSVCMDLLCLHTVMAALLFRLKLGPVTSDVTTIEGRLWAQDNLTWAIWVDGWGESAILCYLLEQATIICPADPTEDQQGLITAVNYINVSCLLSLSERRYVKTTEALIVLCVCFFFFIALTSALSCAGLQSGAPASPSVSGKTGIWSCNLQDASRGRSHRSQLEEGPEKKKKEKKKS